MSQPRASTRSHSLSSVAIFKKLTPEARSRIEKRCAWRTFETGEPIVGYLDTSTDVHFIVAGEARASIFSADGKAVTFSDLRPGDIFGEYAAIDGGARSASIEARSTCVVAAMSAAAFREVLEADPQIAMSLIRQLVAKVRALTTRIYEFSSLAVSNRIQAELLRLASLVPQAGNGAEIDPAPNHADIASRTSTHREAVTRELSRLSRLGIVERRGRRLVVKDMRRLAALVHEATGE